MLASAGSSLEVEFPWFIPFKCILSVTFQLLVTSSIYRELREI